MDHAFKEFPDQLGGRMQIGTFNTLQARSGREALTPFLQSGKDSGEDMNVGGRLIG
jgi:hypothetical protein